MNMIFLLIMFLSGSAAASITGFATLTYTKTSENAYVDGSYSGAIDLSAGLTISHILSDYAILKFRSTTDYPIDYAFADISNSGNYGVRIGRVNRLSGMFSGDGPYIDNLNYLPDGTHPRRYGKSLYRFDGLQFYAGKSFTYNDFFSVELTYGKPVLDNVAGMFDLSVYNVITPDDLKIDAERPIPYLSVMYQKSGLEVFADYLDARVSITESLRLVPVKNVIRGYKIETVNLGAGYSFDSTEIIFSYLRSSGNWRNVDNKLSESVRSAIGNPIVLHGNSVLIRHYLTPNTSMYAHASNYRSGFNPDRLAETGIPVARDSFFHRQCAVGVSIGHGNWLFVAGASINSGTANLDAGINNPWTAKRRWAMIDTSITYLIR
jgi:hypothetical protein